MIKYKELTKGERFWVMRRRSGERADESAKRLGVSEDRISAWENGRDLDRCPNVVIHKTLSTGEALAIARRRKGWNLKSTARRMKASHVTLIKWENDRNSTQEVAVKFWNRQGWPVARVA